MILPRVEAGDADTISDIARAGQRARVQGSHEERLKEAVRAVLAQAALLRVCSTKHQNQTEQPWQKTVPGITHCCVYGRIRNTGTRHFVVVHYYWVPVLLLRVFNNVIPHQ